MRAIALPARSICLVSEGASCKPGQTLYEQSINLAEVSQMVVGRTHYGIHLQQDTLSLQPHLRMQLYQEAHPPSLSGVQWQMAPLDIWRIAERAPAFLCAGLGLLALVLLIALVAWLWSRSRVLALLIPAATLLTGLAVGYFWQGLTYPVLAVVLSGLVIALLAALVHFLRRAISPANALILAAALLQIGLGLLAWLLGPRLGEGWFLLMASVGMLWVVLLPARSFLWLLTMSLAAVLAACGLASQLALGMASPEWGGARFFGSMAACCLIWFSLQYAVARLADKGQLPRLRSSQADWLLGLLALLALAGLILQVIKGNEAGVFGFQPIEAAKLTLVLLTAHFLALRLGWQHAATHLSAFSLWLRFMAPVAMMLALMLTALILVHDNSPIVLIAVWLWILLLGWYFACGNKTSLLMAFALLALASVGLYAVQTGMADLQFFSLYPDRIQTWLAPSLHQHTGEQFRRAIKLAESGGLLGNSDVQPWRIPEVQNDFTPAFFLARFGAVGGALLAGLQALLLASLLGQSWGCLQRARGSHDVVWAGRLRYFLIWGFAGFLLAHFVVSWGTNLGALPVMGQPMPFLSSAGSLILLFLCPLHCLLANTSQSEK
ncbi:FtsW/RodA/SpoVE family cell cycle protein [Chitinilyticum aquatile]|uniref:FtsW/RodA/SpoVE family cell cycle protein n=1 Tax=Chitinilyticum aquatile TaxID=362520 RepID=UPI00138AF3B7|nr:FtsW/RodA/SpoVE family cell cycle protein [Chitinilyticum aquatile]